MARHRLELRSLGFVVVAYVAAALTAPLADWFFMVAGSPSSGPIDWVQALSPLTAVVIIGGAICLVVELVIVTPLLFGFRRHGWKWLNGGSAALIGFMAGALFAFAAATLPLSPGYSESGQFGVGHVANGVLTNAGWTNVLVGSLTTGAAGMIGAIVFRLVAVRRVLEP